MGASVGIGALIMGVTLLSIFAVASTMLTNQIQVAIEVTEPKVSEQPEVTLSAAKDSGALTGTKVTVTATGEDYPAGTLVFTLGGGESCDTLPAGTYTVEPDELFTVEFNPDANAGTFTINDGEYWAFSDVYVWYDTNGDGLGDPTPGGGLITPILVNINGMTLESQVADETNTRINSVGGSPPYSSSWNAADTFIDVTFTGNMVDATDGDIGADISVSTAIQAGAIDVITITDDGAGCTAVPSVDAQAGGTGAAFNVEMQFDVTFDLTNDGDATLPIDEIFVSLDDENTVAVEEPTVLSDSYSRSGYIFPGETISVTIDQNSGVVHTRIAISSHGASVGAAL